MRYPPDLCDGQRGSRLHSALRVLASRIYRIRPHSRGNAECLRKNKTYQKRMALPHVALDVTTIDGTQTRHETVTPGTALAEFTKTAEMGRLANQRWSTASTLPDEVAGSVPKTDKRQFNCTVDSN